MRDPVDQNLILRIQHKTLKRLTFDDGNSHPRYYHHFVQFNTPSLVYLDYSGCVLVHHCPYTSSPLDSLVQAKLDLRPSTSDYRSSYLYPIIIFMRTVKTLSLSSAFVKEMYTTGMEIPFFLNLVTLYFESDTKQGWKVMLRRLLNQSPKLETLVLKGLHGVGNQGISIDHNEVKVLEIYGFSGRCGELKLVKCFLRQMQFLQVMKVRIDADNNMKLQLTNQLLALRKRHSFKCQILFL